MQKIGFCDRYGLTKAVLNGTKTMTRRVIKDVSMIQLLNELEEDDKVYTQNADIEIIKEKIARYKLGEIVAVAQSYSTILKELEDPHNFTCMEHWESASSKRAHYAEYMQMEVCPGWTNKLFVSSTEMIHQIQIDGVRIERLQDISDEDCLKEGIIRRDDMINSQMEDVVRYTFENSFVGGVYKTYATPREAFAALIERPGVGRKGLWQEKPWVVVYEFKLVK